MAQISNHATFQYGGQAVIEGVMMRGPERVATAVRVGENIVVEAEEVSPWGESASFLRWPLVRGTVVLIESMVIGIKTLNRSATLASGEDEEESLSSAEIGLTVVIALLLGIALFIILPTWLGVLTRQWIGIWGQNAVEGVIRLVIFLGYIVAIHSFADIKRVFQYHGAEHKAINTYESGAELTVAEVSKRSKLHPACGTSFILIVLVISILVFAVLGNGVWWWKFSARLLLLPLIAGLGYEFLRYSRLHRDKVGWLIAPGLWLQKLTTGEPDAGQIEVAITALQRVLYSPSTARSDNSNG
jgi:uncharacterized protein YqhQ